MSKQDAPLNCDQVRRALIEEPGTTLAPGRVERHLRNCSDCRAFARALNPPVPVERPAPKILREIEESILADLHPVSPAAPARNTFAVLVAIFGCVVAACASWLGAFALAVMSPLEASVIFGALAAAAWLMALSLARQMIPGSKHGLPPGPLPVGVIVSLTLVIAVLFPLQQEPRFWRAAWFCISRGTLIAMLAGVLFWVVLRRSAILSPVMTGAATGLLAGLAGESALQIHCPILDARHILTAHLGVAVLCTIAGFVIGCLVELKAVSGP